MLVLTRKPDEVLVLQTADGRCVQITVTSVRGDKVRLGIEAPLDVRVMRKELLEVA